MRPLCLSGAMLDTLPPHWRLALAYAPAATRDRWLTLLALDVRLGSIVRGAREPMLAQMKLAWWRDRLAQQAAEWPKGEPLLAALACWQDGHGVLAGLVDGWEALLGEAPLGEAALLALAEGRVAAVAALGGDAVMARGWALADVAAHLGHPDERAVLERLIAEHDWRGRRVPRAQRPLAILHGIARHGRGDPVKMQKIPLFTLMRLGLFGI